MSFVPRSGLLFSSDCSSEVSRFLKSYGRHVTSSNRRKSVATFNSLAQKSREELLVVVGGGPAGVYGAIRAKTLAPHLKVLIIEKGRLLSKVKISGGGRCNLTNGHFVDRMTLAEHYPRGNKELKSSFFHLHGPVDTMSWFSDHGVELKVEDDGRVFPVSNNSSSIIDCLLLEARERGVKLETGKVVTALSTTVNGKFLLKIERHAIDHVENVEAEYLLISSGSSKKGYSIASQLGHSIVDPVPSLFTFKINDSKLLELSGVAFPKVKAKLKLENVSKSIFQFTQVGPMLVTHWGISGPVILRLSAWGARDLFSSGYKGTLLVDFTPDLHIEDVKSILLNAGTLLVDFTPDLHIEDVKSILIKQKNQFTKHKMLNACPSEFRLTKRFWKYLLDREGLDGGILCASVSIKSLQSLASLLKQCPFEITGKGQFKDEFVTAGGVPLSEISLNTMESRIQRHLFFAGEVLNIDGITGGFNFQNAWSGGYIAGTTIGELVSSS